MKSKTTTSLLSSISTQDKNTIGKDFGEILGGIFLGKHVGIKKGLDFPKGNEPLVDFYIDGYKISSKYLVRFDILSIPMSLWDIDAPKTPATIPFGNKVVWYFKP